MAEATFDSNRLAELMTKHDYNDYTLGRATGISKSMIGYLRRGERKSTSAENILKLAEVLQTTPEYLLGKEDPSKEELPDAISRLSAVAGKLSEVRQEELLRIAEGLAQLEREQTAQPLPSALMRLLVELAENMRLQGISEAEIASLEAILRRRSGGWQIDLSRSTQDPDKPK